ncbi:MAG: RtcB family protein [Deltaproteobacteria bacterium]|nr:RtcB family protein [Deltaproteobacteria bacterium]
MFTPLPDHTRLLGGAKVHFEAEALDQLATVSRLPRCVRAVGLPDLHPGPGIPIGAAFALDGEVRPLLVGGDAGCGVRLFAAPRVKASGDALERRVREATDGPALPDVDPGLALRAAWSQGPRGLATLPGVPESLAELAAACPAELELSLPPPPDDPELGLALGSVGGGNHFVELSEVTAISDRAAAEALGLRRGGAVVLAHSGSRGLGRALIGRWGDVVLTAETAEQYLLELEGAVRFARANRLVLAWRLLSAAGIARPGRWTHTFDLVHNDVTRRVLDGREVFLHRKGAAPAERDQPTVVLGTRGTVSAVMMGAGDEESLCCVAHGAGRRLKRSDAIARFKDRHRRAELTRTALGGRVICDDPELLYAEHPDAYKDVDPVIDALEAAGAARRVATLSPVITVKR